LVRYLEQKEATRMELTPLSSPSLPSPGLSEATTQLPASAAARETSPSLPKDVVSFAAPAPTTKGTVQVSYNPQDPTVMSTSTKEVAASEVGTNLSNARIKMDDKVAAKPDANGNFIGEPGTRAYQQAESFIAADSALRLFEGALGHDIKWNFSGALKVHPLGGDGFNAYYQQQDGSINFLGEVDKKTKQRLEASESLEVVSHECGHAILDGLRPGLLGWFSSTEAGAFHEAFGDTVAMLTSMQDDRVLDKLVEQTGGDLHKENIVAKMGEQLSQGINDNYLNDSKPADWTIRNANNALKYQDPKNLPDNPSDETKLGKEVHNFSRVWSATMWDVVAAIASDAQSKGASPKAAIIQGRDALLTLISHGVELGPDRMKKYSQIAASMLAADTRYEHGAYQQILKQAFAARNISTVESAHVDLTASPSLRAAQAPRNLTEATAWLTTHRSQLNVPAEVPLQPRSLVTNKQGETFATFDYVQEVPIGEQYATDLGGTLTVGFDRNGNVFHSLFEPVDAEQIAAATETIEGHIARGEIRGIAAPSGHEVAAPAAGRPAGEVVPSSNQSALAGRIRIARIPSAE
jgi:Fungalysin metallopeptidase (M36)